MDQVTLLQGSTSNGATVFQLWGIPAIFLVLGFAFGLFASFYVKRPKVIVCGGGSGGATGPDSYYSYGIRVRNTRGWIGLPRAGVKLFGWRIIGPNYVGVPVARDPAERCTAELLDEDGNRLAFLLWRRLTEPYDNAQYMTLSPGDDAEIIPFAQRNSQSPTYFAYDARDEIVKEPNNDQNFHEPRRFKVRIRDGYGQWQRILTYEVKLRDSDGSRQQGGRVTCRRLGDHGTRRSCSLLQASPNTRSVTLAAWLPGGANPTRSAGRRAQRAVRRLPTPLHGDLGISHKVCAAEPPRRT